MNQTLSFAQIITKGIIRFQNLILDFNLYLLYLVGYIPFHSLRRLFYRISGLKIGKESAIHMWARFYDPGNIQIGEDTIIGDHAFLDGRLNITIGNHTDIASEVRIYNSEHDIQSEDFKATQAPVTISDYVFIGPRVTIMPGVIIGEGAVVAGGAVVTRNVEPFTIVGGVPAKVIGTRNLQNPHYRLGRARLFQ